jgi:hypothetical protein
LIFHKDAWTTEIRAQLPQSLHLHNSLVYIVARPRVCGILGNGTHVYAITATANILIHGLCDSGANLCMTNNPNILVDVCPWEPFTILLATTDGGHSHTNVCCSRGLLPLPLLDSTSYYQTCFVNPYASETFISPQAIVNSSAVTFDKWQVEGFSEGGPGILSMYSPSGLLKMSIQLCNRMASTTAQLTRLQLIPTPACIHPLLWAPPSLYPHWTSTSSTTTTMTTTTTLHVPTSPTFTIPLQPQTKSMTNSHPHDVNHHAHANQYVDPPHSNQ